MKTKVLFHGTDFEGMQGILANGFQSNESGKYVWNDSEPNATYFYDLEKMNNEEEECIYQAFGNAQLAAAVHGSPSKKLYVIRLMIDAELVSDDESDINGNMADSTSYVMTSDLKDVPFTVYEFPEGYEPGLRFEYLTGAKRDAVYTGEFSEIEQVIYDGYKSSGVLWDLGIADMETTRNFCHSGTLPEMDLYVIDGINSEENVRFTRDILESFANDYFLQFDCRHNAEKYPDLSERIGQFVRGGSYFFTENFDQMQEDMNRYFGNDCASWDDYYNSIGSRLFCLLEAFQPETFDIWLNK